MPLADDIRELGRKSGAALNDSHDYFTQAEAAWRLLQLTVKSGGRFTVTNKTTGTVVNAPTLSSLAHDYIKEYLRKSTFQHFVSVFEAFIFDLLHLWLTAHPESLSAKDVKFGDVLKAGTVADVTLLVVDKELNELKYGRAADWFKYLEGRAQLGCPTEAEIETIAEIKATRDILVHNRGIVNATYLSKTGKRARYKDGEQLEILVPYFESSWKTLQKVIREVTDAAARKA